MDNFHLKLFYSHHDAGEVGAYKWGVAARRLHGRHLVALYIFPPPFLVLDIFHVKDDIHYSINKIKTVQQFWIQTQPTMFMKNVRDDMRIVMHRVSLFWKTSEIVEICLHRRRSWGVTWKVARRPTNHVHEEGERHEDCDAERQLLPRVGGCLESKNHLSSKC